MAKGEPAMLTPADLNQLRLWFKECSAAWGRLPKGVEEVHVRLLRSVGRAVLPDGGPVFLKFMHFPRKKDRLRYAFRSLPAMHEARMLQRLDAAGIPCPEPLWVASQR